MEQIDIPEYHSRLKAQGVSARRHIASKCPMCGTVQSAESLIRAGAGNGEEDVERFQAYSCVGRFRHHARLPKDAQGCDWTLGGLLQMHKLEVVDENGKAHPRFEVATPEEAQSLEASWANSAAEIVDG